VKCGSSIIAQCRMEAGAMVKAITMFEDFAENVK